MEPLAAVSGPTAIFRLSGGHDLLLSVALQQDAGSALAADIAFRFLQRLSLATAERLEWLLTTQGGTGETGEVVTVPPDRPRSSDSLRSKSQATPILALAARFDAVAVASHPELAPHGAWDGSRARWPLTLHSEKSDRLESDGSGMTHGWNTALCRGAAPPPQSSYPHVDPHRHAGEIALGLSPRPAAADLARPGDRRPPEHPGAVWTVHQPSIYRATAQIVIEPPQFDPVLSTLVSNIVSPRDAEAAEKYIPNRIAMLKSKVMGEQVFINDPTLAATGLAGQEAADELIANLQARLIQGTNQVTVSLEGTDPARTVKQLSLLLELLRKQARDEVFQKNVDSKDDAEASLKQLEGESRMLNEKIYEMLRKHADTIGPEGKNIKQAQFEIARLALDAEARRGSGNSSNRPGWRSHSRA